MQTTTAGRPTVKSPEAALYFQSDGDERQTPPQEGRNGSWELLALRRLVTSQSATLTSRLPFLFLPTIVLAGLEGLKKSSPPPPDTFKSTSTKRGKQERLFYTRPLFDIEESSA